MGENQALAQFAIGDEESARQAFDILSIHARPYLHTYLRAKGLADEQKDIREDVVQDTLSRVWGTRRSYRNEGVEAWRGFLKKIAHNCLVDTIRRRQSHPETLLDETYVGECADMLGAVLNAQEQQTLGRHADILWLGLDSTFPFEAHTPRLLAAQLFYLDGLPWNQIPRLLGPPKLGEPPLTRATLDAWLADPGVLRHLAYHTLYYNNDRLAAFLLGLDAPGDLDAVRRTAADAAPDALGPGGWTWAETSVILWRYRHALLHNHILQRDDCALSSELLTDLIDRTLACFPFSKEMVSLLNTLGRGDGRQ